ncbi:MAG: DUF4430 domain-containing protein [bacterium]
MKKITKIYLFVFLTFFLFPLLKVSADDIHPTDTAPDQVSTSTTPLTPDSASTSTTSTSTPDTNSTSTYVNVFIRYNDQVLFNDQVQIPTDSTAQVSVSDNTNTIGQILAQSALAALEEADVQSNNFNISDLKHYSNGYFVNCINVTTGTTTNSCTWNYVVNGESPWDAIDQKILHNGDNLTLYFGQPRQLVLPGNSGTSSTSFMVTAQTYDYINNLWNPLSNVVVGATQSDPNNPWSPIVIATSTTDNLGNTNFTITATGTYNFGLEEDYYYPTYPFEILDATSTIISTSTNQNSSSGGGSNTIHQLPDLEKMLNFLDANQKNDGSFGSDLYTDWAAIAYGSTSGHTSAKNKLINFIKTETFNGTSITDYERRVMAILALGLNPYTEGKDNYVKNITDSFDGNQIGNSSLFNDDIFGIITLLNSGYSSSENIIQKAAQFIISKQSSNGEWDSVDLTGAAIQALSLARNVSGTEQAISKGLNFLKTAQTSNGGYSNPDSTSWAIQGLIAGNSDPKQLISNGNNPFDYLASNQLADGSIGTTTDDLDTRVWATEWAIPATAQMTWSEILKSVSKPAESSGGGLPVTNASTTIVLATTTSTTTLPLVIQTSTSTTSTSTIKNNITAKQTNFASQNFNGRATTATSTQNTNQLAGVAGSGFNFDTQKIFMILGSILAGIGLFSIILI